MFKRRKLFVLAPADHGGEVLVDIGGSNGLNLEWCDDEYHKELEARSRSADAETPWQISAASSAVLGVIFTTLAGDLTPWSLAVGAALGAAAGAAVGEYAMRSLRVRE